jgi:hypothetical protein
MLVYFAGQPIFSTGDVIIYFLVFVVIPIFLVSLLVRKILNSSKGHNKTRNKAPSVSLVKLVIIVSLCFIIGLLAVWRTYDYLDNRSFLKRNKQLAEKIDFTVYSPTYLLEDTQEKTKIKDVAISDVSDVAPNPYVYMHFEGTAVSIYQFDINKIDSGGTGFCGPDLPEKNSIEDYLKAIQPECKYVGTSTNGFNIYEKNLAGTTVSEYYSTKQSTRISITGIQISNQEAMKIFTGLKEVKPIELPFQHHR